jgi:hypothetical protein
LVKHEQEIRAKELTLCGLLHESKESGLEDTAVDGPGGCIVLVNTIGNSWYVGTEDSDVDCASPETCQNAKREEEAENTYLEASMEAKSVSMRRALTRGGAPSRR